MCFMDSGPKPGPGRVPLASAGGEVELAGVFVSVASVAVNSMSEFIFWNLVRKKNYEIAPKKTGTN